jgi:hypothetical protein
MKSIIIVSERKINDHVGEYYDEIIEVPHQPTAKGISVIAKQVRESIVKLWQEDKENLERTDEPRIEAYLDAASPFNAMLIDYQIVLAETDEIKLELPYLDSSERTTCSDREANELIEKLERKGEAEDAKV